MIDINVYLKSNPELSFIRMYGKELGMQRFDMNQIRSEGYNNIVEYVNSTVETLVSHDVNCVVHYMHLN